jgi:hypothetical protein
MKTYEAILEDVKQLHNPKFNAIANKKEIEFLTDKMDEDEKILYFVDVTMERIFIMVVTTKKLIFVRKGFISGLQAHALTYDNLLGCKFRKGIFLGEILIQARGENMELKNVNNSEGITVVDLINDTILKMQDTKEEDVILARIEKLASLRDRGIITEEEFADKKQDLLDQL